MANPMCFNMNSDIGCTYCNGLDSSISCYVKPPAGSGNYNCSSCQDECRQSCVVEDECYIETLNDLATEHAIYKAGADADPADYQIILPQNPEPTPMPTDDLPF